MKNDKVVTWWVCSLPSWELEGNEEQKTVKSRRTGMKNETEKNQNKKQ